MKLLRVQTLLAVNTWIDTLQSFESLLFSQCFDMSHGKQRLKTRISLCDCGETKMQQLSLGNINGRLALYQTK